MAWEERKGYGVFTFSFKFLILKRGGPGLHDPPGPPCFPVISEAPGSRVDATHLQVLKNLHGTKDLDLGAGVMVAQKDFSLVSVQPWAEGHLGAHMLSGGMAARDGGGDQQCCFFHAEMFQLLVRQPVHHDRAEVPACGDEDVPLSPLSCP